MSTKENIIPLSQKRENIKSVLDTNKLVSSKQAIKDVKTSLVSKPGLKETKVNHTKLEIVEKPTHAITYKKEKEQQKDIPVYISEKPRRSPSPHSTEILLEYHESRINIHHRKEPKFLQLEPSISNTKSTTDLEKQLKQEIKHRDELTIKVQSARKELESIKNQQAQKIDHKIHQVTKYKASIQSIKEEIDENQAIYEELVSILETANEKGLHFEQELSRYDDQINDLLDVLSLTKYRIQEFKESH